MAAEYLLDVLGDKPVLALPTHRRDATAADEANRLLNRGTLVARGAGGMTSRHESVNPTGVKGDAMKLLRAVACMSPHTDRTVNVHKAEVHIPMDCIWLKRLPCHAVIPGM